ncbi:unnamed protein product [Moneuplotes crassus]|uniref:Uncharacterized protein n=1 Tax=Euplotes crassus TaxID=5936 RepID=A0AAD1UH95_EUPCR|nr:unnamed protein product [Moneuplotes crassus]
MVKDKYQQKFQPYQSRLGNMKNFRATTTFFNQPSFKRKQTKRSPSQDKTNFSTNSGALASSPNTDLLESSRIPTTMGRIDICTRNGDSSMTPDAFLPKNSKKHQYYFSEVKRASGHTPCQIFTDIQMKKKLDTHSGNTSHKMRAYDDQAASIRLDSRFPKIKSLSPVKNTTIHEPLAATTMHFNESVLCQKWKKPTTKFYEAYKSYLKSRKKAERICSKHKRLQLMYDTRKISPESFK